MPDLNDTSSQGTGTPDDDASNDASATASTNQDQVSLLTSRLNGQTAKVGELSAQKKAAEEALAAAQKQIADLQNGVISAEEAAKAQVAAANAALEQERQARRIDTLKARFPETFSELGDDVAAVMDEAKLVAIEARLIGEGAGESEPPTPMQHNESRSSAAAGRGKEETAADVEAKLLSMPTPW